MNENITVFPFFCHLRFKQLTWWNHETMHTIKVFFFLFKNRFFDFPPRQQQLRKCGTRAIASRCLSSAAAILITSASFSCRVLTHTRFTVLDSIVSSVPMVFLLFQAQPPIFFPTFLSWYLDALLIIQKLYVNFFFQLSFFLFSLLCPPPICFLPVPFECVFWWQRWKKGLKLPKSKKRGKSFVKISLIALSLDFS